MKLVVLEPFLLELVDNLGLLERVVAVSDACSKLNAKFAGIRRLTIHYGGIDGTATRSVVQLGEHLVALDELRELAPDKILLSFADDSLERRCGYFPVESQEVSEKLGKQLRVISYKPLTLDDVFETIDALGTELAAAGRGREIAQRCKAQMMDWCDNFYDRMKHKRVTVISRIDPLTLAGYWIPEMIQMCSCQSQEPRKGYPPRRIDWSEVVAFRPDVIIIALMGEPASQAAKTFPALQKFPNWEDIPAVKRGELVFADGIEEFYMPNLKIVRAMSTLVSAAAGLDSGFITERDSFYRLRWVELHRHKL